MNQLHTKRAYTRLAFGSIGVALLASATVVFLIPASPTVMDIFSVHLRTASALLVTITACGGGMLFLQGIQHFKTRLRIAYILLAAGVMVFGIALIQLPIIGFLDLWNSWWANSGLIIVPFVFASFLIYYGMRQFAVLLGIRNRITSVTSVLSIALVGIALSFGAGSLFARYRTVPGTAMYIAIVAWAAVLVTAAALLGRSILKRIGPFYESAMGRLVFALLILAASAWHEYAINFFMDNSSWYVAHGTSFIPFILSGLLLLRAGYAFALLGQTVPYIPVVQDPQDTQANDLAASLRAITTLVPNTHATNSLLHSTQATITQANSSRPGPITTRRLSTAYRNLEQYLMHKDPLRTYQKEELRKQLQPRLREAVEKLDITRSRHAP